MSRAVLVTGASRGIGRAVAQAFAALGDRVAVHYGRSAEEAGRTVESLAGGGHVTVQADIGDSAEVRRAVEAAASQLGGLDVVVNNAGVYLPASPTRSSYDEWQAAWARTLAVNLVGAANVTFCAIPHLQARGGVVVNVSSRGAFRGEPEHPAYGAAKAGLNAFGQSMAIALAPLGIAVATVAPGFVETDMAQSALAGPDGESIRRQSPFNRVARPHEVASAVVWLASPEARFASGTIIDVNGASYLRS